MMTALLTLLYFAIGAQFGRGIKATEPGLVLGVVALWLPLTCAAAWLAWFRPWHGALVWKVKVRS